MALNAMANLRPKNILESTQRIETLATALVMAFLTGIFGEGFDEIGEDGSFRAAQARGVVHTIIVVSVLAAVGIMVLVIIYGATDDVIANQTSSPLDSTLDDFFETIDSVWTLVAVSLIMLVIGVVIAVLNRSM